MSVRFKLVIGVLIVLMMGITSFWGVYAPTFSEADAFALQVEGPNDNMIGDIICVPKLQQGDETVLLTFKDKERWDQLVNKTPETITLSYQGQILYEGSPGTDAEIVIPLASFPPPLRSRLLNNAE